MKISSLLIGAIVIISVVALFSISMSKVSTEYGVTSTDTYMQSIQAKQEQLSNTTEDLRSQINSYNTTYSTSDILGSFFQSGYTVVKSFGQSISLFQDMASSSVEQLPLQESQETILTMVLGILVVVVIVGILLSVILGRDI